MMRDDDAGLETRFLAFHRENPHVYDALVGIARSVTARGVTRFGIAAVFERLRWISRFDTVGDPYRLNNSYRAYYARLIMEQEPDLAGLFDTRESPHDPDYYDKVEAAERPADEGRSGATGPVDVPLPFGS